MSETSEQKYMDERGFRTFVAGLKKLIPTHMSQLINDIGMEGGAPGTGGGVANVNIISNDEILILFNNEGD